ncbi:glycosyltransferase [Tsuneonella sp. HG249]
MADPVAASGFVVIGRDEGERLVRCLRSLVPAGRPIVYVDSGSRDGSCDNAAELGAAVVRLGPGRPFTAARARADGAAELRKRWPETQYVMFIDGDCELEPRFLPTAARLLQEDPGLAAVCGRRRERFPEASLYNRLIDREWDTPIGETGSCGGDALFRTQAYEQAGGFDPGMLAGEEPELCSRLLERGWRIRRIDAPMTIHDAAMTRFAQWWRRAVRSGMGYAQAWRRTRRRSTGPLYSRQIVRAAGWAGVLPAASIALALLASPWLFLVWPAAAALQFVRLARRGGMAAGALAVAGKYAELLGMAKFTMRAATGAHSDAVTYK